MDGDQTDPGETAPRGRGHRRALGLIVLAVLLVTAASFAYLRPQEPQPSTATLPAASSPPLTTLGYLVTYHFASPLLGWELETTRPLRDAEASSTPSQFWIFRTPDGAKHWQLQLKGRVGLRVGGTQSIQFFDKTHGFVAVGVPIELHRTVDGGTNWVTVGLPSAEVVSVTFSDPRHGWLLERKAASLIPVLRLYATGDAGDTWQQLPDPPPDSITMTFRSPSEGWMSAGGQEPARVYDSADGGRSWQAHDLEPPREPPPSSTLSTSVRLLPGAGVVATVLGPDTPSMSAPEWALPFNRPTFGGYEVTSFDRGASWTYIPHHSGQPFVDAESFQDALHWWMVEQGSLYKSSDSGQTWSPVSDYVESREDALYRDYFAYVLDSKHAWAKVQTGEGTGLAVTNDGGLHWARVAVPQPA